MALDTTRHEEPLVEPLFLGGLFHGDAVVDVLGKPSTVFTQWVGRELRRAGSLPCCGVIKAFALGVSDESVIL